MPDELAPLGDIDAKWRRHVSCVNGIPEQWEYPDEDDEDKDDPDRLALLDDGKKVCQGCSVRVECLDDDLIYGYGGTIRGGLDDSQKLKLNRHRTRYAQYFVADVTPALERVKSLSRDVRIKMNG